MDSWSVIRRFLSIKVALTECVIHQERPRFKILAMTIVELGASPNEVFHLWGRRLVNGCQAKARWSPTPRLLRRLPSLLFRRLPSRLARHPPDGASSQMVSC